MEQIDSTEVANDLTAADVDRMADEAEEKRHQQANADALEHAKLRIIDLVSVALSKFARQHDQALASRGMKVTTSMTGFDIDVLVDQQPHRFTFTAENIALVPVD